MPKHSTFLYQPDLNGCARCGAPSRWYTCLNCMSATFYARSGSRAPSVQGPPGCPGNGEPATLEGDGNGVALHVVGDWKQRRAHWERIAERLP